MVPVQPGLLQQEQKDCHAQQGLDISIKGVCIHVTESTPMPLLQGFLRRCSMLNDATCFKAVYIVCGYTDLRSGMDRLAALVEAQTIHALAHIGIPCDDVNVCCNGNITKHETYLRYI